MFRLKNFSKQKKVILENIASLSFLEAANYLIPMVTLPYLVRVLGVGNYGLIIFARAFIQYFVIFTSYGFGLSASREISIHRKDPEKVNEIFSSVILIQTFFMVLSFGLLAISLLAIPKFKEHWLVYIFSFGIVIDQVLFPVWFYQGMERMKHITRIKVIAKLIFTAAIFLFVKKSEHFIIVPLLNSLGLIVGGIISVHLILNSFKVRLYIPEWNRIMYYLKDGWNIFISLASINLYTTTNAFILGIITNNVVVGYYAAGEKLITAITYLFRPVFKALYPYFSKIVIISKDLAVKRLRKLLFITILVSSIGFVFVFLSSEKIILLLFGQGLDTTVLIVKILSPLIIIVPIAAIFANLTLLPFKLDVYFSRIYIMGGIMNIIFLVILVFAMKLGGVGVAISKLLTESMLTITMFIVLKKNKINLVS